jgi:hypothetical protein
MADLRRGFWTRETGSGPTPWQIYDDDDGGGGGDEVICMKLKNRGKGTYFGEGSIGVRGQLLRKGVLCHRPQ